MQKGKYRFIVQRTQKVLLTITDEEQFKQDFTHWANLLGQDRAEEVTELDYLRSRARALNHLACPVSIEIEANNERLYIEDIRTCRHCGCTEDEACSLSTGPCSWVADDLCSNPSCVDLEAAQAEKEVAL